MKAYDVLVTMFGMNEVTLLDGELVRHRTTQRPGTFSIRLRGFV